MFPTRWNWRKIFYYGEVVCFITAWAIGLGIALQIEQPVSNDELTGRIALTGDLSGVQATMNTSGDERRRPSHKTPGDF